VLNDIKTQSPWSASPRVMESLFSLTDFLMSEVRQLEAGNDAGKRDQIPYDKVKDPPAVARELRWRLRQIDGFHSDEEEQANLARNHLNGTKRKRTVSASPVSDDEASRFKHFKPRAWEKVDEKHEELRVRTEKARQLFMQDGVSGEGEWLGKITALEDKESSATVKGRRDLLVKLRRTEKGAELHRIERVIEIWDWT
jgi:hypothetical protein